MTFCVLYGLKTATTESKLDALSWPMACGMARVILAESPDYCAQALELRDDGSIHRLFDGEREIVVAQGE